MKRVDIRLALTQSPPPDGKPIKISCPNKEKHKRGDERPSLAVYRDGLFCFACGFQLQNTKEALKYLTQGKGKYQEYVVEQGAQRGEQKLEEAPLTPLPLAYAKLYHRFLYEQRAERVGWYEGRGLTDETIRRHLLGHDGTRFTIPVFNGRGELISIRYRSDEEYDEEGPKYSGWQGRNRVFLFPEQEIARDRKGWLVVSESELCAYLLRQENIPSGTVTNGVGQLIHLPRLLKPYPHVKELYFAVDMDKAGIGVLEKLLNECRKEGYKAKEIVWNRGLGKDVTELFVNGMGEDMFGWYRYRRARSIFD